MFAPTNLFNRVPCPEASNCGLINCLFRHDDAPLRPTSLPVEVAAVEPASKRRKLNGVSSPKAVTTQPVLNKKNAISIHARSDEKPSEEAHKPKEELPETKQQGEVCAQPRKPVSPPPARKDSKVKDDEASVVALNPRRVAREPAQFSTRLLYLQKLHEQLSRMNKLALLDRRAKDVRLNERQVIMLALEFEEQIATEDPAVYSNVLKSRVMELKRMNIEHWIKQRTEAQLAPKNTKPVKPADVEVSIYSGLTQKQDLQILETLVTDQHGLEKHGYVTNIPTANDIAEARAVAEVGHGWECCERCKSRFQVFPERRAEDGALTTNGPCTYHPGRMKNTPGLEKVYSCCNEPSWSRGCTEAKMHVYKMVGAAGLASVLQFESAPPNPTAEGNAITFDCEMGYTSYGLELIRLTAISWPTNQLLLDTLVRPLGQVLDFNTRFSGVSTEDFANATPYEQSAQGITAAHDDPSRINDTKRSNRALPIVASPQEARRILFSHMSPLTVLIGHAIENDLNAVRIVHPRIVDTALLYPHHKGLPYRPSLKILSSKHLDRGIQAQSATGHDSLEDAKATGDLVRLKVKQAWLKMKYAGWTVSSGEDALLIPPPSAAIGEGEGVGKNSHRL